MTNTTKKEFQPEMNKPVWIQSKKTKGIVKAIHESEAKTKVTFFDPKTNAKERKTVWFWNTNLAPFDSTKRIKKQKVEKTKVEEVIEGSKKFNQELKEYLAPVNSGEQIAPDTSLMLMAIDLAKVITAHNAEKIGNNLKSIATKVDQKKKEELVIKVKYFADIESLSKFSKGDWIDLRSADTIEMKAGEFKLIPLGVGMKLPEGYEANVVPRSSTFKHFGIIQTNHYGVIDNSYSGNEDQWFFPAYALRDTVINKNDRICQFRINKTMPDVSLIQVENLDENSRGGLGSTGKK